MNKQPTYHLAIQLELERVTTLTTLQQLMQSSGVNNEPMCRHMQTKLRRIEIAQQRLVEQQYGICLECQKPIELERLELLPYTELCFSCQRRLEKQTLQQARLRVAA